MTLPRRAQVLENAQGRDVAIGAELVGGARERGEIAGVGNTRIVAARRRAARAEGGELQKSVLISL